MRTPRTVTTPDDTGASPGCLQKCLGVSVELLKLLFSGCNFDRVSNGSDQKRDGTKQIKPTVVTNIDDDGDAGKEEHQTREDDRNGDLAARGDKRSAECQRISTRCVGDEPLENYI